MNTSNLTVFVYDREWSSTRPKAIDNVAFVEFDHDNGQAHLVTNPGKLLVIRHIYVKIGDISTIQSA